MDVSIVIVNYNTRDYLKDSLGSIYSQKNNIPYEVIVVDNNSTDGSKLLWRDSEFKNIKFIENKENLGFARGCNQGIALSKGRYILVLNPDTVVLNDAIEKMVRFMDENKSVGISGPKILNPDGTIQYSCRKFPNHLFILFGRNSIFTKVSPNNRFSKKYLMSDWNHDENREVDWVSGASLMLRRELIDDIGLFDENFFMFNEDVDICLRAKKAGWSVKYFAEASVIHYIGSSHGKVANRLIIERHKGMAHFYHKHYKKNLICTMITDAAIIMRGFLFLLINNLRVKSV